MDVSQSFVDEQEWTPNRVNLSISHQLTVFRLHSHLSISHSLTQKSENDKTWQIPTFSVSGKARRRPGFFVWNILVVMVTASVTSHSSTTPLCVLTAACVSFAAAECLLDLLTVPHQHADVCLTCCQFPISTLTSV